MQPARRGVALGPFQKVHEGSDPSCQINGLLPGSSYVSEVSALRAGESDSVGVFGAKCRDFLDTTHTPRLFPPQPTIAALSQGVGSFPDLHELEQSGTLQLPCY